MSTKTSIEWTDCTWNPVRGCSLVSAGCTNCYAMKQAHRFSGKGKPYEGLTELGPHGPRWNGKIMLVPDALEEPLRWKTPRWPLPTRVFVNSMSDLFHEDVPELFLDQVFAVMAIARQHTYQILTKRPERMRDYFAGLAEKPSRRLYESVRGMFRYKGSTGQLGPEDSIPTGISVPFSNVWLGVSVEDQATADERIPLLLKTPAALRFVSYEPALGPVDFWGARYRLPDGGLGSAFAWGKGINWMIIGGESGPKARPFDLAWARSAIAECKAAECAVFVKQLGAHPYVEKDLTGFAKFVEASDRGIDLPGYLACLKDRKGGDIQEWPIDLRVRDYPR